MVSMQQYDPTSIHAMSLVRALLVVAIQSATRYLELQQMADGWFVEQLRKLLCLS